LSIELTLRSCQRDIQQALFDPGNTMHNCWKGTASAVPDMGRKTKGFSEGRKRNVLLARRRRRVR
jgi:hypothetical protein